MKAAVIQGPFVMKVEQRPDPEVGEDDVLVRVRAAGICGSDLHGFQGLSKDRRKPGLIMGHEAAGEVAAVGKKVTGLKKGDRIVIDPQRACGQCYACRNGWANLCDNMLVIGSSMRQFLNGAMCEYIAIPSRQIHRLADGVSFQEGAMLDPIGNALHIFGRSGVQIGDIVAIFGAGTIGLIAVQTARIKGVGKIISVDISAKRLKLAKQFGADIVVNSSIDDPVGVILGETNGRGADLVVEAVGHSVTYGNCVKSVRKRGKVMALGFLESEITIPIQPLLFREISIVGCTGFVFECDTALDLLAQGKLNVKPIITHEFPIDDVQLAFTTACDPKADALKTMVIP